MARCMIEGSIHPGDTVQVSTKPAKGEKEAKMVFQTIPAEEPEENGNGQEAPISTEA